MTLLTDVQKHYIALKLTEYAHRYMFSTSIMNEADLRLNADNFCRQHGISAENFMRYVVEILVASAIKGIFPHDYAVKNTSPLKRGFGQHPDFGRIALIQIENGTSMVLHLEFMRDREIISKATGIDPSQIDAFFYEFIYRKES